jgi:hypothetical protein
MSERIRVQLQQGHNHLDSETPNEISASATIAALSKLHSRTRKFKSDSKWEREQASAVFRATDWVRRVKQAGGFMPLHGSGNVQRFEFIYKQQWEGKTYDHPRHHAIALMCDDIDATVKELQMKGAQFRGPVEEREYGRVIMMIVPGADDIQLYQPTHKLAYNL